jgi:prolyl-tRNA synthetase
MVGDIYTTDDDNLVLAPTAEEEMTRLVSEIVFSHKQLPVKLYQIGPKFRRESRPRGGLLRLREFLMKDLYTFDKDLESALATYQSIIDSYENIFKTLELPAFQCKASSGTMGGIQSTEFHLVTDVGEDRVLHCSVCNQTKNAEITEDCCNSPKMTEYKGLELGHAFLLGDRYSRALNGYFTDQVMSKKPFQMGCFGIGVSRLLAAIVEAKHDHEGIVWPESVAPFKASIIFESPNCESEIPNFMSLFQGNPDILVDDRVGMSIGKKLKDQLLIGIPRIIVLGQKWKSEGLIEYHHRKSQKCEFLRLDELGVRLVSCEPSILNIKMS